MKSDSQKLEAIKAVISERVHMASCLSDAKVNKVFDILNESPSNQGCVCGAYKWAHADGSPCPGKTPFHENRPKKNNTKEPKCGCLDYSKDQECNLSYCENKKEERCTCPEGWQQKGYPPFPHSKQCLLYGGEPKLPSERVWEIARKKTPGLMYPGIDSVLDYLDEQHGK